MKTTRYIAALAVLAMAFVGFSVIVADNADAAAVVLDGDLMGYANNGDSINPMVVKYYEQTAGSTTQNYIVLEFDGKAPTSAFKLYAINGTNVKTIPVVATDSIVFGWITLTADQTYRIIVDPIDGSADRTVDITVQKTVEVTYHANMAGVDTVTEYLAVSQDVTLQNKFAGITTATYVGYINGSTYTPDEDDVIIITADPTDSLIANTSSFTDVNTVDLYTMWTKTISFNANGGTGTMTNLDVFINANISTQKLTANSFTLYNFAGWYTSAMPTNNTAILIDNEALVNADFINKYATQASLTLYAIWTATLAYNGNGGTGTVESQTFYIGYDNNANAVIPGTLVAENGFVKPGYSFTIWNILNAQSAVTEVTIQPGADLSSKSAAVIAGIVATEGQNPTYTATLKATWEVRTISVDVFITDISADNKVTAKVNDLDGEDLIVGSKLKLGGTYYTNATFNNANVLVYGDIEDLSLTPAVVSGNVSPSMTLTVDMTTYTPYWVYAVYSDSNDSKIGESYGVLKGEEAKEVVTLTATDKTGATVEGVTITSAGAQLKGTTVTLTAAGVPEGKVVTFYSEEECTNVITTIIMDGDKTVYYKVTDD